MNDRQNTVVATIAAALVLIPLFFCPWRVTSSDAITWGPIFRPPATYVRSYDNRQSREGSTRLEYEQGEIAVGIMALEVLAVVAVGGVVYVLTGDIEED